MAPGALENMGWLFLCKATKALSDVSIFVLKLDHFSYFKYLHPTNSVAFSMSEK